jgi:methanogenic corrinoid protein MtbC1
MDVGQQQAISGAPGEHLNLFADGAADFRHARRSRLAAPEPKLAQAIEADVIPRLVLARTQIAAPAAEGPETSPYSAAEIATFGEGLIGNDPDAPTSYAFGLFARGATAESLFLALLAPAARHLGDLWLADQCSFAHVTLGVWRLQKLLRDLTPAFQQAAVRADVNRNILLISLPEDQHTFGVTMLAEFFRRARWNVACSNSLASIGDMSDLVRREWFSVIGLSMNSDLRLDEFAKLVRLMRQCSCNRAVGIMVGGSVFLEHPEYVARVGADLTAIDGRQAPLLAEMLASAAPGSAA